MSGVGRNYRPWPSKENGLAAIQITVSCILKCRNRSSRHRLKKAGDIPLTPLRHGRQDEVFDPVPDLGLADAGVHDVFVDAHPPRQVFAPRVQVKRFQQLNVLFRGLPAKSRTAQAAIGGGGKSSLFILLVAFALGIGITLAVLYWDDVSPRMSPKYDAQLWLVWLKFKVQHFGFFKVFSVITIVTIIIGSLLMYATKKS